MKRLLYIFGEVKNYEGIYKVPYTYNRQNYYNQFVFDEEMTAQINRCECDECCEGLGIESFNKSYYEALKANGFDIAEVFRTYTDEEFVEFLKITDGELLEPNSEFKNLVENEIQNRLGVIKENYYRDYRNEERIKLFISECYSIMKQNRKEYLDKERRISRAISEAKTKLANYAKTYSEVYKEYNELFGAKENYFNIENLGELDYDDVTSLIQNEMIDISLLDPNKSNMQLISNIVSQKIDELCVNDEMEEIEDVLKETYGKLTLTAKNAIRCEMNKKESMKNIYDFLLKNQNDLKDVESN